MIAAGCPKSGRRVRQALGLTSGVVYVLAGTSANAGVAVCSCASGRLCGTFRLDEWVLGWQPCPVMGETLPL